MAKLSYLQLTNHVLKRISQAEIADVTAATGQAKIITELINEAQNELWAETNWYSLYKTRMFTTISYASAGVIAFVEGGASADTITDANTGFVTAGLSAGMMVLVSGSTSNDGVYMIDTVAAGTLTLATSEDLTNETATAGAVTITVITYPIASDWGRTIALIDITNDTILIEDNGRAFDEDDPNLDTTGNPLYFTVEGAFYRLYPVPAGAYKIRDRYWQLPDALSANANTSDLPIECENLIIAIAQMNILDYLQKYEAADRLRIKIYGQIPGDQRSMLNRAKLANQRIINKMYIMGGSTYINGIAPPRFPSKYGRYC